MPPTVVLVVVAVATVVALAYGYRILTALLVLRSLPSAETGTTPPVVGGDGDAEPVALTGELVVEEPVETAAAAVEDTARPVGAYLWRARFPDNTNGDLTIEEWGWERQRWHTFASGVEWGRFGVATGGRTVRIDPSWLRETTGAEPLTDLEVGGMMSPERFSVTLWDSWYTYVRDRTEHRSLRRFAGHVRRHDDGIDLDRYLLEARPLCEGTTVSVRGELRVEDGEPVVGGSDGTPLLLSDAGFDGHRAWLRRQVARRVAVVAVAAVVVASVLVGFYVPLAVLAVGWVLYLGYSFARDAGDIADWLRRVLG